MRADILGEMERQSAESIRGEMGPEDAAAARELLFYEDDVAGGLMRTEQLSYRAFDTVQHVVDDLREHAATYSDFDVQYAYVVDRMDRLTGVLRMRDLLLADRSHTMAQLMIPNPVSVHHQLPLVELRHLFDEKEYIGLPVVDDQQRLLGVVMRDAVYDATTEAAEEDFLKASGLSGREELRSMPLRLRARRRLSWLSINILLNVAAASVIAFY